MNIWLLLFTSLIVASIIGICLAISQFGWLPVLGVVGSGITICIFIKLIEHTILRG
jgi:hypothetical protein